MTANNAPIPVDVTTYATYEQNYVKCWLRGFPGYRYLSTMSNPRYRIDIAVHARYLADQSKPGDQHYVFAYTVKLRNSGAIGARLMTRHWRISDAEGSIQEVRGEGVIGQQPWLAPGLEFEYTSGTVLATSVGSMTGSYQMLADDGTLFEAPIAAFTLSVPRTLH